MMLSCAAAATMRGANKTFIRKTGKEILWPVSNYFMKPFSLVPLN